MLWFPRVELSHQLVLAFLVIISHAKVKPHSFPTVVSEKRGSVLSNDHRRFNIWAYLRLLTEAQGFTVCMCFLGFAQVVFHTGQAGARCRLACTLVLAVPLFSLVLNVGR